MTARKGRQPTDECSRIAAKILEPGVTHLPPGFTVAVVVTGPEGVGLGASNGHQPEAIAASLLMAARAVLEVEGIDLDEREINGARKLDA